MLDQLITTFQHHRNPARAIQMAAYMKDKFPFLGIAKPVRAALQRPFITHARKAPAIDRAAVIALWALPEREFQYLAVDYLLALKDKLSRDDINIISSLITAKPWWDTVDNLATIVGALCARYPDLIGTHILPWAASSDIWLARVAILFQLKYKANTDVDLLARIIRHNSGGKEFFINKAIGWALREYSKTDKAWVKSFIATNRLHPLSVREGGKYTH